MEGNTDEETEHEGEGKGSMGKEMGRVRGTEGWREEISMRVVVKKKERVEWKKEKYMYREGYRTLQSARSPVLKTCTFTADCAHTGDFFRKCSQKAPTNQHLDIFLIRFVSKSYKLLVRCTNLCVTSYYRNNNVLYLYE